MGLYFFRKRKQTLFSGKLKKIPCIGAVAGVSVQGVVLLTGGAILGPRLAPAPALPAGKCKENRCFFFFLLHTSRRSPRPFGIFFLTCPWPKIFVLFLSGSVCCCWNVSYATSGEYVCKTTTNPKAVVFMYDNSLGFGKHTHSQFANTFWRGQLPTNPQARTCVVKKNTNKMGRTKKKTHNKRDVGRQQNEQLIP